MSKIMYLADLHLDNFPEFATLTTHKQTGLPINSRLNDILETLVRCVLEANDKGVRYLVVAGDVYDKRKAVATDVAQFAYWFFSYVVNDLGWKVYMMTGNHDQLDRAGKIHSLYGFRDICEVIDYPLEIEIAGVSHDFIPYMESAEDMKHCLARACMNDPVEILVCHYGVEGAYIGAMEYRIKAPVTLSDIDAARFKFVVMGHYHKPQSLERNVMYIGSPAQLNRAEIGDAKRYLIYDSNTKKMTSHLTHAKEFKTITDVELTQIGNLPDHYYDVIVSGDLDANDIAASAADKSVKLIKPKKAKVSDKRIELSETMTDEDILKGYLKYKGANPKLLTSGITILNKVLQTSSPYTSMSFHDLIVHNFMAISNVRINLHKPGEVWAIMGDNRDNTAYDSNGTGKSAMLPEAIFWCLFDKTARKLPADKVVNRWAKRDCYVRMLIKLNKDKLVVTRFRKHKKLGGTGLHLVLNGVDQTQGTPELTEALLAKLIGIDYTTFSSVVAFSPDNLRFVGATDASQKQVLDSILQTKRFSDALAVAKGVQSELKTNALNLSAELSRDNGLLETARETQADYIQRDAQFQERENERMTALRAKIDETITKKSEQFGFFEEADAELKELGKQREIAFESLVDEDALSTKWEKVMEARLNASIDSQHACHQLEQIQARLDAALEQAGKPCPTCGVPVANTGKMIANLQKERNDAIKRKDAKHLSFVEASEVYQSVVAERAAARRLREKYEKIKEDYEVCEESVSALSRSISLLSQKLLALDLMKDQKPVNDFDTLIPQINDKIEGLLASIDSNRTLLAKVEKQVKAMEFWVAAYGNAGIRSFLLDQILPDLTQYANEFSESLTGGGTLIEFSSYNEDTMKDKFKIHAWNQDGSDVYAGNSSGEKRRVDICVMFALFRIAHQRTKFNILLLDEVLDTLDGAGLVNIVDSVYSLARELKLAIYVTSHTTLNQSIHDQITLVKHKGQTTIKE